MDTDINLEEIQPEPLGPVTNTERGFEIIHFTDHYGAACSLQQSSIALVAQPGASCVWLGVNDADPKVMASEAAKFGIKTAQTTGWVPYPIPAGVQLNTRMHLELPQVCSLIEALQQWVSTGTLSAPDEE